MVHGPSRAQLPALGGGEAAARIIAFGGCRRGDGEELGVIVFARRGCLLVSVVDTEFEHGHRRWSAAARRDLGSFVPAVLAFRLMLALAVIAIGAPWRSRLLPQAEGRIAALYVVALIPLAAEYPMGPWGWTAHPSGLARTTGELVVLIFWVVLAVGAGTGSCSRACRWRNSPATHRHDDRRCWVGWLNPFAVRFDGPVVATSSSASRTIVGSTLLGVPSCAIRVVLLQEGLYRDSATVGFCASAYALLSFLLNIGGMYALTLIPALTRLAKEPERRASRCRASRRGRRCSRCVARSRSAVG